MLILTLLLIGAFLGLIVDHLLDEGDPYAIPFTFASLICTITAIMLLIS